jgi:hypothetical protein
MDYWTKIKEFKNGNYVSFEKNHAFYVVKVYKGTELHDKILCDSYQGARNYFRAFKAVAKNA